MGEVGDLAEKPLSQIRDAVASSYPDKSTYVIGNWTRQLDRFTNQMRKGDLVIMPLSYTGEGSFAIGRVAGDYEYLVDPEGRARHSRAVAWKRKDVSKDEVRSDIRAPMGSLLTVCGLERNNSASRLELVSNSEAGPGPEGAGQDVESYAGIAESAPVSVSVRRLLELAGLHRRTALNLATVVERLSKEGLVTEDLDDKGMDEEAIPLICQNRFLVVGEDDGATESKLVSIDDLVRVLGADRIPFLFIEDIELRLRHTVSLHLSDTDILQAQGVRPNSLEEMTIGSYPHLFLAPGIWEQLGWDQVDRDLLVDRLRVVASLRNDLMHFSVQEPDEEGQRALEGVLRVLSANGIGR